MTNKKEDKNIENKQTQEERVEIAKFIADKSQKLSNITVQVKESALRVMRWMSDRFDQILFNPKHGKLVAFIIALMITIGFNSNSVSTPLQSNRDITVPVTVNYNSEMYEISEVPKTITVTLIGTMNDLTMLNTDSPTIKAVLDLTGLTDGNHNVKYRMEGLSNRIRTIMQPESQNVSVDIKNAAKATIGYDFINQHQLGQQYVLSEPEFEVYDVSIKASQKTLDEVAFVKALIDVAGKTEDFETESSLVAYDQNGNKLEQVDIIPKTVKVKVGVSSPYKSVPITPIIDGELPEGKTVSSINLDVESIMIYAPQSILETIDEIRVPISTAQLTGDSTKFQQAIKLPAGVRYGAVSKVNIEVKLGEASSATFDNIPIVYRNNVNGLKASLVNKEDATVSVTVLGTQENLAKFEEEKIAVYIDLRNAEVGEGIEFELFINYVDASSPLYSITPSKTKILLDIMR